jgi:DNA-binding NarL/FixJ family response regulator
LRVLVASHDPANALQITDRLGNTGFDTIGGCVDAARTIDVAIAARPDLCVLDLPVRASGIDIAGQIRSLLPKTGIVLLARAPEARDLLAAMAVGADAYVSRESALRRLPALLLSVAGGQTAYPGELVQALLSTTTPTQRRSEN